MAAKQNVAPANSQPAAAKAESGLIFKVQIFALNRSLRPGSQQFKGHKNVESYRDGNVFKYTIGSSANYNEMVKLRKSLMEDFPESFVIAFKDGKRIDINQALIDYRKK